MNNKDKIFLANLQETMKEFVKADIGRAAKADLAALEKAAGNAKKLADAGVILAQAKAHYDKCVVDGDKRAGEIVAAAKVEIKTVQASLDLERHQIANSRAGLEKGNDVLAVKELGLESREAAVENRESAVSRREEAVAVLEEKLSRREKDIVDDEAEIERFQSQMNIVQPLLPSKVKKAGVVR